MGTSGERGTYRDRSASVSALVQIAQGNHQNVRTGRGVEYLEQFSIFTGSTDWMQHVPRRLTMFLLEDAVVRKTTSTQAEL